jgi:hypothetical protein
MDRHNAVQLFRHIAQTFEEMLWRRDHDKLDAVTSAIEQLTKGNIDSITDFVLFCIFCAARKAGFEEVYIEVSDRNPLFNQYTDQSAAFAELFALGSRCESYFDIKPSDIGVLLSKKHRDHYNQAQHQPPMWLFNAPSFASAYAAAQTDIDPNQTAAPMPGFRRLTFLSVFSIPALVGMLIARPLVQYPRSTDISSDILLLSTIGHGLYLSTEMSDDQLRYATLALMCSLLLSGAIGTWISVGGTYYLISTAFSAANMFVLTRLVGGLAFTLAGCVVGFIVLSAVKAVELAAVFSLYLFGLTAYLTMLAALSTYQIPGSSFLNGRRVIIAVIPTLTVSPILTIFCPGYDIFIYPCILYAFVVLLFLGTRHIASQWVSRYHGIRTLNDGDIKEWYIQRCNNRSREASATQHECEFPYRLKSPLFY